MVYRRKVTVSDTNKSDGKSCWSTPSVYHAAIVIFLEFFAFGLLTTPMISVLDETFPKYTFLMNGVIHGLKGFLSFLSAPFLGALSDMFGRKPFLLLTVTFTCSPIPLMKISHWWYFTMISISGIFAVTFSVALAYVADITTEEDRSWGYGLVSATFAASLVSSPAIGAYLGRMYSEELVVALSTAIAFLDICFILACVPESLPEKVRTNHMCSITTLSGPSSKFSWGKADPLAALRQMTNDYLVLIICITTFLSYLPEAGQYSCFFVYLRLVMGFSEENVALFIAVVGIMSCISQTLFLSFLNRFLSPKRIIIVGLIFEALQLTLYGFAVQPVFLWTAGLVAAMGSITYPALSAFISNHAAADQQGVAQGLVTGIRGLCGGLGPALFGLIFYIFRVDLHPQVPSGFIQQINRSKTSESDSIILNTVQQIQEQLMPGPPFAFGAILVLLAIFVAVFIPENSRHNFLTNSSNLDTQTNIPPTMYGETTRQRRTSPTGRSNLNYSIHDDDNINNGKDVNNNDDLISFPQKSYDWKLSSSLHIQHHHDAEGFWGRFISTLSDFRSSNPAKRTVRILRQPTVRFAHVGIVEPLRRLFVKKPTNFSSVQNSLTNHSGIPFTLIPSNLDLDNQIGNNNNNNNKNLINNNNNNNIVGNTNHCYSNNLTKNEFLFTNSLLINHSETEAADLSNYRSYHFKGLLNCSQTNDNMTNNRSNNNDHSHHNMIANSITTNTTSTVTTTTNNNNNINNKRPESQQYLNRQNSERLLYYTNYALNESNEHKDEESEDDKKYLLRSLI